MRATHHIAWAAFLFAGFSYGYFAQGGGANVNSRFDLTRAIVEQRTLSIDAFHDNTIDKASRDGHFYSDKAPGLSLAAVPPYAIFLSAMEAQDPADNEPTSEALYLLTASTVTLSSAVAAAGLVWLLITFGVHPLLAFGSMVFWTTGTNAFAYGSSFVAHQFVASLLLLALCCVRQAELALDAGSNAARLWLALAGMLLGWSVISELPAAVPSALLGLYALRGAHSAQRLGLIAWLLLGALPPALLLMGYNTLCFGSPLALSYGSVHSATFRQVHAHGFYGIGLPHPVVLWELLCGEFRGLLPLSPGFVLAAPGWYWMLRDPARRRLGVLTLCLCLSYLLVIAGYTFWHGGTAMGPRHLVPILPFAAIPVAAALQHFLSVSSGPWKQIALTLSGLLIALSIAICTISVAVYPEFPDSETYKLPGQTRPTTKALRPGEVEVDFLVVGQPVRNIVWPMWQADQMSQKVVRRGLIGVESQWPLPAHHHWDAFNLGEIVGFQGRSSLVPLLAVWVLILASVARRHRS